MSQNAMNAPKRFLFDTSFEPEELAIKKAADVPQPKYFDEDLAQARAEGYAEGENAGRAQVLESIEQDVDKCVAAITQDLTELRQHLNSMQDRQTRDAVQVAATLVRKLFPRLAREHGLAEIDNVVAEAMARLREEPRIVVRIPESLLDTVRDRVETAAKAAGFEGRIVFLAEDSLASGDVRIEWADGGAERDTGRIWQDIEQLIQRIVCAPERTRGSAEASKTSEPQSESGDSRGAAA
jgi:flagellar assembly protein FliH